MSWGMRTFARTYAAQFEPHGDGRMTILTEQGCRVTARKVVFATGYESQQVLQQKVAKLISTYALASEPVREISGWRDQCLIWETARPYVYMRMTAVVA